MIFFLVFVLIAISSQAFFYFLMKESKSDLELFGEELED